MRNLILILGDQLNLDNPALAGYRAPHDRVLMIEAPGEATHVWSHKARIALFLSAMRHFAERLRASRYALDYVALTAAGPDDFCGRLRHYLQQSKPQRLIVCEPGEYRLLAAIRAVCEEAALPLEVCEDCHFFCTRNAFARWAGTNRTLRMEFFYRQMRRTTGILMEDGKPAGGAWNFDKENRSAFGKSGPGRIPGHARFTPDAITREVLRLVESRFPGHPGSLSDFGWPVQPAEAQQALDRFVHERLQNFGRYQDAMWTATPFGWHSLLSAALNLKLLDPREVVRAAETAWHEQRAPLPAVEGFIRQVLGWREFIRGVYWLDMPQLGKANHFGHTRALPAWYWTGDTGMKCMREAIGQSLAFGYAHHIQRLMVTGNFALLAGIEPHQVCDWYLAMYVDAVEWAELPNTAGMALYANGGRFTSKPYVASGAYIKRMSNYCDGCRYDPRASTGERACPFTALYWNFLDRNESELACNPRTTLMARSVARLEPAARRSTRRTAGSMLEHLDRL